MAKKDKRYTTEFIERAVKLALSSTSICGTAKDLGIPTSTLLKGFLLPPSIRGPKIASLIIHHRLHSYSMQIDEIYYKAYKKKDTKFDGIFFIGVLSTRIYCRPVCTAKMPKQKNCLFFPTALAASIKGFRPCRRCRPELVPGFSNVDITLYLAQSAKKLIEGGALDTLAEHIGITSRHLRRIFIDKFGVTPIKFVQAQRLLFAEKLLKNTNLAITYLALKSGFKSIRQFNSLFKLYYHINPRQFRREHKQKMLDNN